MKNEKPRGCKAPGFLINSFAFTLGVAPLTRLTFFIAKKTLRAAPCRPHLAGRTLRAAFAKSWHPEPPSAGQTYFEPGVLQPSYSWGGAPTPALLFSLQKSKQKSSTPGSHKIYFYPGILQLPTVGQVKCLYNSVKNKFYRRLQRGALNGNNTAKAMRKKAPYFMPFVPVQE